MIKEDKNLLNKIEIEIFFFIKINFIYFIEKYNFIYFNFF